MLQRRDCNIWATAQVPQRGTSCVGILSSSWKGKKSSDILQAVPNSMDYVEPLEDSAWSQNVDSAASMYPPPTLPLTLDLAWGEDYQDLSSWCHKLQPDMVADTKGSSCTAQDDELNTPEVGVQHDFNFTASCNVLKENNTSQYLSEGWDTSPLLPSPPLYVPQKSSFKEPSKKTDTDNTQSVTANEFFVDDGCVLSVSHEEEIVTSHNVEGLNLEFVQSKESDSIKKSVNLYTLGVPNADKSMDIDNCGSKDSLVGIEAETDKCTDVKMANCVANTGKVVSLGSLLGSDFCVKREGNDYPVHTNQLQAEENLDLKNVLSGNSFHSGSNDEMKSVDGTWGCDTVVSKVTDAVLSRKCEIIRPAGPNTYMMMQTVGSEEGVGKVVSIDGHTHAAEFKGRKETTSAFGTDIPTQIQQQSLPVNSELTGNAEHVEISAKSLAGMNLEPHVMDTRANEDVPGGNLGMQQQVALKEQSATHKNMKLNLSTAWEGTDDNISISTPDVMEFLLKQNGNFDLIGYVFSNPKEFQQDLLPVIGDDRISDETAKVEPIIEQVDLSPNDAESLDNSESDAAVKVEVVEPFCVAKSDDEQSDSVFEPMELVEGEVHCSLEQRSDQLCERQRRTDVKKDLKGNKGQQIQKVTGTRNGVQLDSILESRIVHDGSDLRLKISKVKVSTGQTGRRRVALPQEQVPPKENGSELKKLALTKRTRGRPAKQALPSTSEENETHTNRSPRRKSCSEDEPWILPSKRTRLTSGESCDRYRELRDKNNEASRKSRQNRKARELEMKEYAAKLASDNQTLKIKADEMERLVKKLRQALLEAVVVKTKKQ